MHWTPFQLSWFALRQNLATKLFSFGVEIYGLLHPSKFPLLFKVNVVHDRRAPHYDKSEPNYPTSHSSIVLKVVPLLRV
jgi:hypothetical protein